MTEAEWRAVGHRMRVTRLALGMTEQQAADGWGVTLRTYRRYEAGGRQISAVPPCKFAQKYDVSLDWLFDGDATTTKRHLAVGAGKIAILPVTSPKLRSVQRVGAP